MRLKVLYEKLFISQNLVIVTPLFVAELKSFMTSSLLIDLFDLLAFIDLSDTPIL